MTGPPLVCGTRLRQVEPGAELHENTHPYRRVLAAYGPDAVEHCECNAASIRHSVFQDDMQSAGRQQQFAKRADRNIEYFGHLR